MAASITPSVLFYDPVGQHQPSLLDPDIVYVQQLNVLEQQITADQCIQQVVCICCDHKSAIIEAIQRYRHIISIYLCKKHHGPEENPIFDRRVREDIELAPDSGWEFEVRLALHEVCATCRYDPPGSDELRRLRAIEQRSLAIPQLGNQPVD